MVTGLEAEDSLRLPRAWAMLHGALQTLFPKLSSLGLSVYLFYLSIGYACELT